MPNPRKVIGWGMMFVMMLVGLACLGMLDTQASAQTMVKVCNGGWCRTVEAPSVVHASAPRVASDAWAYEVPAAVVSTSVSEVSQASTSSTLPGTPSAVSSAVVSYSPAVVSYSEPWVVRSSVVTHAAHSSNHRTGIFRDRHGRFRPVRAVVGRLFGCRR